VRPSATAYNDKERAWLASFSQVASLTSNLDKHTDERKIQYSQMLGLAHAFLTPDIKEEDMSEVRRTLSMALCGIFFSSNSCHGFNT